jgi:hypothetical protein
MGMKMVIRKSNIGNGNDVTALSFNALAWIEQPAGRRLAFVTLRQDQPNFKRFLQHDVIIDGASYFCVDVHTFTPGPYGKGDSIGILVAGA